MLISLMLLFDPLLSTAEIDAFISKGAEIFPNERATTFFSLLKLSSSFSSPLIVGRFIKGIENLSVK